MRFDCPQCATPHEYPDEEIPQGGVVVGCTQCGAHIPLNREVQFDDSKTGIELPEEREDDPRSRSVRIRLDDVDWSDREAPRNVPSVARAAKAHRPSPDGPVDHSGPGTRTMIKRTLSSLSQGLSLSDVASIRSGHAEASESSSATGPNPEEWCYRDLLIALKAPLDLKRLGGSIAACWLVLVACANLDALSLWMLKKSAFLSNLTSVVSSVCLYAGLLLIGAVIAQ